MSDDNGPKTPRETGSRPRWPFHRDRCLKASVSFLELADKFDATAYQKEKVLFKIDRKGAVENRRNAEICRGLAVRCHNLAQVFATWERVEVGLEYRMETIGKMYDLAREARVWNVTL